MNDLEKEKSEEKPLVCAKCGEEIGFLQPYFPQNDGTVLCFTCKRG